MIRLLRGIIYGIAAGIAAAFVLDYLDGEQRDKVIQPKKLKGRKSIRKSATEAAPRPGKTGLPLAGEELTDEAREALLDELGTQLS